MIEEKDVPKLLALAHQHKVIGHVYQRYQNQQSTCPEVMKRLKNAYEPLQKKALRRCSELIRIQQELQKDEIRMMPFKGVTLSEQLFGDPGIKQSSDLDILVDKKKCVECT